MNLQCVTYLTILTLSKLSNDCKTQFSVTGIVVNQLLSKKSCQSSNPLKYKQLFLRFQFRKRHLFVAVASFAILATILGVGFGLAGRNNYLRVSPNPPLNVNKNSILGKFSKAAISTDSADCAPIGL